MHKPENEYAPPMPFKASLGHEIPSAVDRRPPPWLSLLAFATTLYFAFKLISEGMQTIFMLSLGVATICALYSCLRLAAASRPSPHRSILLSTENDMPVFTILLPVYKEAHMISSLLQYIGKLNYPQRFLDIILVCEANDQRTIAAASDCEPRNFRTFVNTNDGPRTKPNALNAAMKIARGDIITVYDAEDRPDPSQLRAAAHALLQDPNLAVVQAPLTYYNANQNWLTRQFTLEYDALFQVWIPFLSKLGLPFPLGGTSNHIRRTALEQVGGWDAHNVTEDADLSFRFAAHGWSLGYITPPTFEEAVNAWRPWCNQRSRWMKGYMQTWLTHMKCPLLPGGIKGLLRQVTLQLTLGTSLVAGLFHVPATILLATVFAYGVLSGTTVSPPLPVIAALIFSYSAGILIGMVGALRTERGNLIISAFAMPLYWALLFIPTLQALWELFFKPFYWNKTDHGDRRSPHH